MTTTLQQLGLTVEGDIIPAYPSEARQFITVDSEGLSIPQLYSWAKAAAGRVGDALQQVGFDPATLETERPTLYESARSYVDNITVARALMVSQSFDAARMYREIANDELDAIKSHQTEFANTLPTVVR